MTHSGQSGRWLAVIFVVLNWNQGEMTADCLESLQAQDYPNFQVIVVDNGSSDGSSAMLRRRFPGITVLENGVNVGYSEGNNIGIECALQRGAEYVFLLNNDTIVAPTMLTQLVTVAEEDPRAGLVGPTMYYADPPDLVWGGESWIDWRRARTIRDRQSGLANQSAPEDQLPKEVDYIDTCAILVKRAVFEQIGFLNRDYFINFDDMDLNMRTRKAGFKIVYVPTARM